MCQDDWIKSAFSDDALVADLLIGLGIPKQRPVLLKWGLRQPRSRHIARSDGGGEERNKKDGPTTRASPTTPLSWSSNSGGGGDGFEESSARLTNSRSKAITPSENNTKRSRKKTFAQLKDHESFLLKDGINLKKALAAERMLYEREKIKFESLKRLKLDLQLQSPLKPATLAKKPTVHRSYLVDSLATDHTDTFLVPSEKCKEMDPVFSRSYPVSDFGNAGRKESVQQDCHSVLPDLNLLPDLNMPFEEELN